VMIEAIARQYLTGSMWRAYAKGGRDFCGIRLPDGLERDQKLPELLITPSTKGIIKGVPGVPEADDVNISRHDLEQHFSAFNFRSREDIEQYETLLREGFELISKELAQLDQIFVDTKFEFGYATDAEGRERLIYMDEVGTPDSSRIWDGPAYRRGQVVEKSKEAFRQGLLNYFADPDVLLDKSRMAERSQLAETTVLPRDIFMQVSETYLGLAEQVTGRKLDLPTNPRAEIIERLRRDYDLID